MNSQTRVELSGGRETPVKVIPCPDDLEELASPEKQRLAREIYEFPGIVVVDGVFDEPTLNGLREGLSDQRRKFKDRFNSGVLPTTTTFKEAYEHAIDLIPRLTQKLFGYGLGENGDLSYRPMITENEPLHFDTYPVECGLTSLMAVANFDVGPRVWRVGPSFREVCRDHRDEVEDILKDRAPGESPSVWLRAAGLRGVGPLREGTAVHEIEFAPGSVWYANPKTISHQIVFGNGALFEQWTVDEPQCACQECLMRIAGVSVPTGQPNQKSAVSG